MRLSTNMHKAPKSRDFLSSPLPRTVFRRIFSKHQDFFDLIPPWLMNFLTFSLVLSFFLFRSPPIGNMFRFCRLAMRSFSTCPCGFNFRRESASSSWRKGVQYYVHTTTPRIAENLGKKASSYLQQKRILAVFELSAAKTLPGGHLQDIAIQNFHRS